MTGSRVVALGHYQPARVLTNDDLAAMVDTSDEWITSRVGIKTRHVGGPDEPVDEMAAHAAAKALATAGLDPADIDLVLVATSTAIDRSPSMSARVAARLGMASPAVMDINVVCSGFTHALATADHAIRAGAATRALVIGADKMADIADWTDRSTCVLLGDGAGAAVVVADPQGGADAAPGIGPVLWGSVPEMGRAVRIEGTPPRFAQEGQSVYRWATTQLPPIARKVCEKAGVTPRISPRWYCIRPICASSNRSPGRSVRSTRSSPGMSWIPAIRPPLRSPWPCRNWWNAARSTAAFRHCFSGSAGTSRTRVR